MTDQTWTFLFTDVVDSTRLWEDHPQVMHAALAFHDGLMEELVNSHQGHVVKGTGDGIHAAFPSASQALLAALAAQLALQQQLWDHIGCLHVRMALHTGSAQPRDGDYYGTAVNRAARLNAIAHGGQVLLSGATQKLVEDEVPPGVQLQGLGQHQLRDLTRPEQVFQLRHPQLPQDFPPLKSLGNLRNNLPRQRNRLVGRERVLAEVKETLQTAHLLTLTGMGGTGKTRLSLQVAADLVETFTDGVWFVELAALEDSGAVAQAVAQVLEIKETSGKPLHETLYDQLAQKRMLLVLDNCEHLVEACACLVDGLLCHCNELWVLATSREGLNIPGECVWPLAPLTVPAPEANGVSLLAGLEHSEAAQLFIERAQAVRPLFRVSEHNASAIASVCRQLDGLPLALELAAARIKVLSVEKLAERLDDRLRLLTGGRRTGLPRQQTLRALIDWSYDILSEPERVLLNRLAAFRGGFTLEAAEAVCADGTLDEVDVLDWLEQLAQKSLVEVHELDGGQIRYRLLESVRHYSQEKLEGTGEAEAVQQRHGAYFLALAEAAVAELEGAEQGAWLQQLDAEHDNLRRALEGGWAAEDDDSLLRMAGALGRFWILHGHFSEGRHWLKRALSREGAPPALRAVGLRWAGALAWQQGDYEQAHALQTQSLALSREAGDPSAEAASLIHLGNVAYSRGDYEEAGRLLQQSLDLQREVGDRYGMAMSLNNLGRVAYDLGELERAQNLYEEGLAIRRELEDKAGIAALLNNLGLVADGLDDLERARALYEEGLSLMQALGEKHGIAALLSNLGAVAYAQDRYEEANELFEESLAIRLELGDKFGTATSLHNLGGVAYAQGDFEVARTFCEQGLALRREIGNKRGVASSLNTLGRVALMQDELERAREFYQESACLRQEIGDKKGIVENLTGLAAVCGGEGDRAAAARLLGAVAASLEAGGGWRDSAERNLYEQTAASLRQGMGQADYEAAFAQGQAFGLEQAVDLARGQAA